MDAGILRVAMEMANEIGDTTKVNAFEKNIYIDGIMPDGNTFHLTLLIDEKENEDANTL